MLHRRRFLLSAAALLPLPFVLGDERMFFNLEMAVAKYLASAA